MSKRREMGLKIQDLPRQAGEAALRTDEAENVKGGIIAVLIGLAKPTDKPDGDTRIA